MSALQEFSVLDCGCETGFIPMLSVAISVALEKRIGLKTQNYSLTPPSCTGEQPFAPPPLKATTYFLFPVALLHKASKDAPKILA